MSPEYFIQVCLSFHRNVVVCIPLSFSRSLFHSVHVSLPPSETLPTTTLSLSLSLSPSLSVGAGPASGPAAGAAEEGQVAAALPAHRPGVGHRRPQGREEDLGPGAGPAR